MGYHPWGLKKVGHEFCFGSGRAILNVRTDNEDEAPTLKPMM